VCKGNETILDFEAAVAAQHVRLQGDTEKVTADPYYFSFSHKKITCASPEVSTASS
jgi:hypothetical protein